MNTLTVLKTEIVTPSPPSNCPLTAKASLAHSHAHFLLAVWPLSYWPEWKLMCSGCLEHTLHPETFPCILLAVSAHQVRLCVTLISRDWLPAGLPQVAWRWAKGSNGQVMLAECFWDWRTRGGRSWAESTGQSGKSCLLGLTEVPRAVPWKYATSLRAQLLPSPSTVQCSFFLHWAIGSNSGSHGPSVS